MTADYARIEKAIRFVEEHVAEQPGLSEIAAAAGLSPFHFQRLFQRFAGVSPKRFLQFLTLEGAKQLLDESRSLLDASFELGLSGPSRLHDLFLNIEKMTPGEYKAGARGLTIRWGVERTPLGDALFAVTDRGLCALSFASELDDVARRWPRAKLVQDGRAIRPAAAALRARMRGKVDRPLSLILKGTDLQLRTWEALLRIPAGQVASYSHVARMVGAPSAVRAVAQAIGQNPIACLIPCHRVLRSSGAFGGYRWGVPRKLALLGLERAAG